MITQPQQKHLTCSHNLKLAEGNQPEERISSPTYARVLPLGDHLTPNVQDDERSSCTISCWTTKTVLAEDTRGQHVSLFHM